ncbi:hypothetical protein CWI39_0096p0010 [Hamiltosporidium magnivora]|uniref:Leucine-rich repeat-containing protein n=1 Tax=Hamiltosporidium magnivora TaxID=148818 RepID=A0A4V2JWT5_9MICR|nr:hypothetical protein CWI39_0096p0010 [Hamiltosporidium magnivora]
MSKIIYCRIPNEAKRFMELKVANNEYFRPKLLPIYIRIAFLLTFVVKCNKCIKVTVQFKNESDVDTFTEYVDFECGHIPGITNEPSNEIVPMLQPQPHASYSLGRESWNRRSYEQIHYHEHTMSERDFGRFLRGEIRNLGEFEDVSSEGFDEQNLGNRLPRTFPADAQAIVPFGEESSRNSQRNPLTSSSIDFRGYNPGENRYTTDYDSQNTVVVRMGHNVVRHKIPAISFEYSSVSIIRLGFFDQLIDSGETEISLDVEDITKEIIDRNMFCLFLRTCFNGLDPKIMGLKKENVLNFVGLIQDFRCYSSSSALNKLYVYLLPFLLEQKREISKFSTIGMSDTDIIRYKKLFIPFLNTIFETIDISFDSLTEELILLKTNTPNKSKSLDFSYQKEIKFRISIEALCILNDNDFKYRTETFFWLIRMYRIKGIKISANDIYFDEIKDSDKACESLLRNNLQPDFEHQTNGLFNIFIMNSLHLSVKNLELDKVSLSVMDVDYLKEFVNLQSLSLVKCILPSSSRLLDEITKLFFRLKQLKIVCFPLSDNFFRGIKNSLIEALDLSCCEYVDIDEWFDLEGPLCNLKELKLDSSKLNDQIFSFFLKSKYLKILSARNVNFREFKDLENFDGFHRIFDFLDISGCNFSESYLNFFSTNLRVRTLIMQNAKDDEAEHRILSSKTLYQSVETLDLRGNILTPDMLASIKKFCSVNNFNLSGSLTDLLDDANDFYTFEDCLKTLNISCNRLKKSFLCFLNRFKNLEEFIAADCNFDSGFMSYLESVKPLNKSLKKIDITGNRVDIFDIIGLRVFENLESIAITLNSKVASDYLEVNVSPFCVNLKVLTLASVYVDEIIFKLIMIHSNIVNLKFVNCKIKVNSFPRELRKELRLLNSVTLFETNVSSTDMKTLEYFRRNGIGVSLKY